MRTGFPARASVRDHLLPKSAVSTQEQRRGARFKLRGTDGQPKFPINDCSDVSDAWGLRGHAGNVQGGQAAVERYVARVAAKLGCKGPWSAGKAFLPQSITKDMQVPELTGEEAVHTEPLTMVLSGLEQLMDQELAEVEPEFDCLATLANIGQQILAWAAYEAGHDGDTAMTTYQEDLG